MSTDLRQSLSHTKQLNLTPQHTPHRPKTPPNFELKTAAKNTPHHTCRKTLPKWRTSPEFAFEFNLRRGSRKALSSKSWGNVKKRVDVMG
jgi:hypothetical protein